MPSDHTKILAEMIAPHKESAAKLLQPNADLSQVSYLASKHQRFGTYDGNQLKFLQRLEDDKKKRTQL